jgi:hypothetical protein
MSHHPRRRLKNVPSTGLKTIITSEGKANAGRMDY